MISGGDLFLSYGAVHAATSLTIIIALSFIVGSLLGGVLFFFLLGAGRSRTILLRVLGIAVVLSVLISIGALAADGAKLGNEAKALQTWASSQKVSLNASQAHDLLVNQSSSGSVGGKVVIVRLSTEPTGAAKLTYSS